MTNKDLIIAMTENGIHGFFSYANAVPDDKLLWRPLDVGRTVLDMAQECAQSADWGVGLIREGKFGGFDDGLIKRMQDERAAWTTVAECEKVCREKSHALYLAIQAFPEERMDETIELPWGKKTYAWWEVMLIHYWNLSYHWGQVAYVQTLYGDEGYY